MIHLSLIISLFSNTWIQESLSLPILSTYIANGTLPQADRNLYAVYKYEVNPDCIWVFGGYVNPTISKPFYCYNKTNDSVTLYDQTTNRAYTRSQGAFFLNNTIYFYSDSSKIITYDPITKNETQVFSTGLGNDGCMAKHGLNDLYPDNELYNSYLYFVKEDGPGNEFYYYNLNAKTLTQGPSLINSTSYGAPQCATHSDYLYISPSVTDSSVTAFQRINITKLLIDPINTKWELLDTIDYQNIICPSDGSTLYFQNSYLLSYNEYIILIGGTSPNGRIGTFNTDTLELKCTSADFPSAMVNFEWHFAEIIVENIIYTFGGFSGSADTDLIQYTNDISPTLQPTNAPTKNPTNTPTNHPTSQPTPAPTELPSKYPTESPTELPTNAPSDNPSMPPSDVPSLPPTNAPSDNPSMTPSDVPSVPPTNGPSYGPTMYPTANPSLGPSNNPTHFPTSKPSIQPTDEPTEHESIQLVDKNDASTIDETNQGLLGIILISKQYNSSVINKTIELQRGLIDSLKIGSVDVRFDLTDVNDIKCDINKITNNNNKVSSSRRRRMQDDNDDIYNTSIEMNVTFETFDLLDGWKYDIEHVITQFEYYLKQSWNITTINDQSFGISLDYLTIDDVIYIEKK